MNSLKVRRVLITLHLWIAALVAPAFLVVAMSGGLHILGGVEKAERIPISVPEGTQFDFQSDGFEDQVRALIKEQNLDVRFDYIRGGPGRAQTRPTSRDFLTLEEGPEGLQVALNKPNFQFALMELHKGHGPRAYRMYQMVVALALFLSVIGGIAVGLLAKNYRSSTLIAFGAGTLLTLLLALV